MKKNINIMVDDNTLLEIFNIGQGVFSPLNGFMNSREYSSVVENMHLSNGSPWTIPITLDIPHAMVSDVVKSEKVCLIGKKFGHVANLLVNDVYKVEYDNDLKKIFGTEDKRHPGVKKESDRSIFRVGGKVDVLVLENGLFPKYALKPKDTKILFKKMNWNTIAGFQTRNPIHRAHEHLQRIAMELVDGIFLQPLIGWKKEGDYTPQAIILAYEEMVKKFYPSQRAMLGVLQTSMRYAGPREAVFHALIRRNYGCTHFIVGRDHAGVGTYYGKYEAQKLCSMFNNLGIIIMPLKEPYYCKRCMTIVTEKHCKHGSEHSLEISGTGLRKLIDDEMPPPPEIMRNEIYNILMDLNKRSKLFITNKNFK